MKNLARLLLVSLIGLFTVGAAAHNHEENLLDLDGLMAAFGWDFDKAEIRTEKLDDNFYVLFGLGGNIGVSIGPQGTLIVDDQFPEMIPKVNAALGKLGSEKINFAINTHWHFDHAEGNLALGPDGTWVVAQENSREKMLSDNVINLVSAQYLQKAYPKDALPVMTFGDRMQFHFNDQTIDLLHFGPAHTTGDAAIYFRGVNAIHMGDVFNRGYPFIDADSGGEIDGMIAFCEAVLGVIDQQTKVIPGHGEVSDYAGLASYIAMLKTVRLRVNELIADGKTFEQILAAKPTAEFDATFGDPAMFLNRTHASLLKKR